MHDCVDPVRRLLRPCSTILLTAAMLVAWGSMRIRGQQPAVRAFAATGDSVSGASSEVDSLLQNGSLDIERVVADPTIPQRTHERLSQRYLGLRVFGGELVRQMDGTTPVSVFGRIYSGIAVKPTPVLSAADATAVAERMAGAVADPSPELLVLPLDAGGYALAYRLRVRTPTDRIIYFVDAGNGSILKQYSDLERQAAVGLGTGVFGETLKVSALAEGGTFVADDRLRPSEILTFDLRGNVSRSLAFLAGSVSLGIPDLASSPTNVWTDGPDVDASVYAGFTYDYYYRRFGRHGLDNADLTISVVVHPASRSGFATASSQVVAMLYVNAFYAGDGVVVYGEGLPPGYLLPPYNQTVNYFAAALDVVAHELSHGVTAFSSGLIYEDESGALNEAFSDVMGVSTKFFFDPPGNGIMQANYELGSDVVRPGGIRSFDNPAVFGDPDNYVNRYVGSADNGGVHTNCTIVDQAFYLMIEGGTNRTSGLSVQGVGAANREQIEQVFYRAFTLMLTANATFADARSATIQAAIDLYGASSAPQVAVTQAWNAVGVP